MGYVKLKKAGGDFDILSAEGVAKAALDTSTTPDSIKVSYFGAAVHEVVITPAANFVQADVTALNGAIGNIGGGSGMIDVSLSQLVTGVTFS